MSATPTVEAFLFLKKVETFQCILHWNQQNSWLYFTDIQKPWLLQEHHETHERDVHVLKGNRTA